VANRVKRVATGWEPQFTIAVDTIVDRTVVLELCEAFFDLQPPTRLKLLDETLSGTLAALTSGQADLALGVVAETVAASGLQVRPLGAQRFLFAIAPHHPLAQSAEPLSDDAIRCHRVVAVADSVRQGAGLTIGLLAGQDVFTVPNMPAKLAAHLRGLGVGTLPECLAQPYVDTGRLVAKRVERCDPPIQVGYAWRKSAATQHGKALHWWLDRLASPATRNALLGGHVGNPR
jgi:DNA-binding transcriptional LysR family regulator